MMKRILLAVCVSILVSAHGPVTAAEPQMSAYEGYPVFTVNPVKPNIMIILDNSGSMNFNAYGSYPGDGGWVLDEFTGAPYHTAAGLDEPTRYYGYFNPDWFYQYSSNVFSHKYKKVGYDTDSCSDAWEIMTTTVVDAGGSATECRTNAQVVSEAIWDGNWLNWSAMRRVDIARKVIMGGKATPRISGGTLYGENPAQSSRYFQRLFDSTGQAAVTPYHDNHRYGIRAGYLYVDTNNNGNPYSGYSRFHLRIKLNENYDPESFRDGELSGVLQRVGEDKAWWGNMWFYFGTGNNREGGFVSNRVGGNMTNMITDLQNTGCDTWTPLGETYYVAMQYFKQEQVDTSLGYHGQATGARNNVNDPYYQDGEFIHCAKSFVILLSDGASTKDARIPAYLKDYVGEGSNVDCNEATGANCDYPSGGTKFLRDIALYARTNDLRPDLEGEQNLILYTIMAAFGFADDDPELLNARELLMDAARKGGPDPWPGHNDYIPDNYFEARDGYQLEADLMAAINDILRRAASGTAVSVLATSAEGEGNLVQAYFQPVVSDGIHETKWVGYLQSLWVDDRGMLREDTTGDAALDVTRDRVVVFDIDANGDTVVKVFAVSAANPYPDVENDTPAEILPMDQIKPLWEAGEVLSSAYTLPTDRNIFTALDEALPDGSPNALFGGGRFNNDSDTLRNLLKPYLGVKNATSWSYLGGNHDQRAHNLIRFIRGHDDGFQGTTDTRRRRVNGYTWPLGDIVHSTPVSVAHPPDNFGVIYADRSYQEFYRFHRNRPDRETVVYVGANDGMLHAFTSWRYDEEEKRFVQPPDTSERIGSELWAYIPRSLLPHLKWLPRQDYSHVYYVDMKPKIFDARIFYNTLGDPDSGTIDDTYHKNGWGTILLGGLRLGGKDINVTDDFNQDGSDTTRTFTASYFAIDISNPRAPRLLWEREYDGLNFSLAEPAALKVGEKWFLTFGSGPQTYDGTMTDTRKSKVYVVDLATGEPIGSGGNDWLFEGDNQRAFLGPPASLDKGLNFSTDAAYFGETYQKPNGSWAGAMYKLTIPQSGGIYDSNPANWSFHQIFDSPTPVTAAPSLSEDFFGNTFIYFGTGRYFSQADKTTTDTQYLFGIKDPFYNSRYQESPHDYYLNYSKVRDPLSIDDLSLFDSSVKALFDADAHKVVHPWACDEAPTGSCVGVPTGDSGSGQVGDIWGDGSCICTYDEWTEATLDPFHPKPVWGCVNKTAGGCDDVPEGVIANTADYRSLYWRAIGVDDDACVGIPFGHLGGWPGSGDTDCVGQEVIPQNWSCWQRPAGDCAAAGVTYGDTGDILQDGGSCYCGYFVTEEGTPGGCDDLDFTNLPTVLNFPDLQGDGTCLGEFVDAPVAMVVDDSGHLTMGFRELVAEARTRDGWVRTLQTPKERALTKPVVLGGLVLFTTYVPQEEVCAFGGESYLYALYFESGTAYSKPVFEDGYVTIDGVTAIRDRLRLGRGMASSVGIHVGRQPDGRATGFVQQSTGAIEAIDLDPAFSIRSGYISWEER